MNILLDIIALNDYMDIPFELSRYFNVHVDNLEISIDGIFYTKPLDNGLSIHKKLDSLDLQDVYKHLTRLEVGA